MPYKLLPDVALADIAFEADSSSLDGLFESSGRALSDIMVDRKTLRAKVRRTIEVEAGDADRLLYDFLTELIVMKDVDSLLFKAYHVKVKENKVLASLEGEEIDRERHKLRNDVKAVTMHMFGVRHEGRRWRATVVLDI
ncbi:MAG TPA: archease [Nitrososphaerales archaeon]|nr:archease [Nitrososphaerales archaeon]